MVKMNSPTIQYREIKFCIIQSKKSKKINIFFGRKNSKKLSHLGYEKVYLPIYKVADTPFHIQKDDLFPVSAGRS